MKANSPELWLWVIILIAMQALFMSPVASEFTKGVAFCVMGFMIGVFLFTRVIGVSRL